MTHTENWAPDSWRKHTALQQPSWDQNEIKSVFEELSSVPPLVFAGEIRALRSSIEKAQNGKGFILQAGDCAESFDAFSAPSIREKLRVILQMAVVLTYQSGVPTIKIGRIAGQFAKPRSEDFEERNGITLPSYRGDVVNDLEFNEQARIADPKRLIRGYNQSASTLNLLRAFTKGGFADLARVHEWNKEFVASTEEGHRFEEIANNITKALDFMRACGIDPENEHQLHEVDFFTSHEALLLDYEEALTRKDSTTGDYYDCSAHLVWIGERTRQLENAHVEFMRGVNNPIGIKLGPSAKPDEVIDLCKRINPNDESGKIVLVVRAGADNVVDVATPIMEKISSAGLPVTWISDPMHGNTYRHASGYKTRNFDDVMKEIEGFFKACKSTKVWPGGVHLELTGDDVTECLGGVDALDDLETRYETRCDPRLNARQGLDLAFRVSELLAS
ncbi:MAG: 3-deoxy-7-phosphoheptulonate synthase class II [Acidimicrobiia bacterium]